MGEGQKKTLVRKQKEQAERRKSILDSAREVFFDKGFTAATMDVIADGCHLAKGTIYLYFKSKEELYVCLMAEGMGLLKQDFDKIADLPFPADRLLAEVLQTYYTFFEKNRQYFRIMFLSSQPDVRERVADEPFREFMDRARECMQVLSDVLEKGMESGVFRKANAWAFANILWCTVNGILMHYEQGSLYREEILKLPLQEMLQEALDLALNGLRAGGPANPPDFPE